MNSNIIKINGTEVHLSPETAKRLEAIGRENNLSLTEVVSFLLRKVN